MIPQDRAPLPTDVDTFGRYFLELLENPGSWIRRQVESIRSTSRDNQEVRYSFDISYTAVVKIAEKYNIQVNGSVLLPLLVLKRQSIVDIDVINHDGRTMNILRRGENAFLTHAAWLASASKDGIELTQDHFDLHPCFRGLEPQTDLKSGISIQQGTLKLNFEVFDLVVAAPIPSDSDPQGNFGVLKIRHHLIIPQNEQQVWTRDKILPTLRLGWRLPYRGIDIIPHLRVEIPEGLIPFKIEKIHNLKTAKESNQVDGEEAFWAYELPPNAGTAFLSKDLVTIRDAPFRETEITEETEAETETNAIAQTVLTVHTRISSSSLLITLIPSLISSMILAFFYHLEKSSQLFTLQLIPYYIAEDDSDYSGSDPLLVEQLISSDSNLAVLTLAAIIPSILGLYISKPKEHYAFSSLVLPYRIALLISAFTLFIFGLTVAVSQPHEIVLGVAIFCLTISTAASMYITWAWLCSVSIYLTDRFGPFNIIFN